MVSLVRVLRLEGRVHVRDQETKLMEVTRLLPQLMFFHLQQSVVVN